MTDKRDKIFSKIFFIPALLIVFYWIIKGLIKLYNWLSGLPIYSSGWWLSIGNFCLSNLSIIIMIYVIICLQVAGVAEFKLKKNFLKAFLLGLVETPPIMMAVWGKRRL
ncbi:MAG: hypothetical protein DRP89_05110 [Candidatus Neomarinimicrobiota bacterium]|nr:MAG: hypothetical protein DRP89_05110 [Candidatus Neomarinimicrobiota bacterium]